MDTIQRTWALTVTVEKEEVLAKDSPGFTVNLLLFPLINEATKIAKDVIATIDYVDKAMKLGANHPIRHFNFFDIVGTDFKLRILEQLDKRTSWMNA